MDFDELFANVCDALRREQRISYRALRRRFELSDDDLEDLDLHALHEALGALKLDQVALSLDALCQQAAKEEWTYSTFLARLLDEELRRLVLDTTKFKE